MRICYYIVIAVPKNNGFGRYEVTRNCPITCCDDLREIEEYIKQSDPELMNESILIVNWQRFENIEANP